ncbi:PAS domain S-box protein [uncultured Methanoregula sp.]|uniref:PAS domain S-box protein n=1 Tax=uncultured Methanoregula sp. TaxID=1005933 RepID=UPI002AABFE7C|nr:PAS domain S-box protein [uncultured Methanoregula sp.]
MTDRKSTGQSPAPDSLKEALQAIEDTLSTGHIPEGPVISADEETRKKLTAILADIVATQQFTLALAKGDLSQDLAAKGRMAGCLKSLQSNLRHLTWQAGQIAGGDLSQRVHFMGDFSDSFNVMVEHLSENEIYRAQREEELRSVNTTLADEIIERRTIEEKIRLQNQIFETIAEGINLVRSRDGVIVYTNSKFDRMFGYDQGELIGKHVSIVNAPEETKSPADTAGGIMAILNSRGEWRGELRNIKKDGTLFWCLVVISAFKHPEFGNVWISAHTDITARKRAEESLQESEDRLRTIIEQSPMSIQVMTPDGRTVQVNHAFEELWGVTLEDLKDYNMLKDEQLTHAGIMPFIEKGFSGEAVTFSPIQYDTHITLGLGEKRWVQGRIYPVRDTSGIIRNVILVHEDISEQKQVEDALRSSEGHLRTLVQTLPDLIWLKDTEGTYLSCNTMFERFFGAKETDIIGKTDFDFVEKDQAGFFRERDRIAMEAGMPVSNEEWITFADDGHRALLETIKTPMYDTGGKLIGVLGIGHDITRRKKIEDDLRQSEERFRTMSETSLTGIYIFLDGVVKYVNPTFARIYGYTPGEMTGMDPMTLVHPDDRARVREKMQGRLDREEEISVYECRMVTRDNRTLFVNIMGVLIPYEGRLAISGNLLDITERKRAEEVLRESEERYRTLFDESPISLWEEDLSDIRYWFDTRKGEGIRDFRNYFETHPEEVVSCVRMVNVTRINHASTALFGARSLQEFSEGLSSVFTPESYDMFREELVALSQGKTGFECEVFVQTLSGEKKITLLKLIVVPGFEQTLGKVVVSLLDITERKKMEDALRQANKKIGMLSSITRHDIRNQLLSLRGFLGLSRMKTKDPELLRFLAKGDSAAEAIGSQIEFTKYYEDIGVNAPEWQDIIELIQTARSQLPIPDTIDVKVDLSPVKVFADGLIEKVFYNLLENTLRHGERVSRIRLSFHETDRGAEIVYEDNGVGISPEDKPHLFQKGFGKNTGLGLFLSQEILAITGLTMRETGEPGKGVRFVITIPKDGYRLSGNE